MISPDSPPLFVPHRRDSYSPLDHPQLSIRPAFSIFAMTAAPVSTTADLFYAVEPEDGGLVYQYADIEPPAGERVRNFELEAKSVVIENLRGKEDSLSLDTTGFKFYKHASKLTTFDNDEEIRRVFYPESIELIKKLTGASRVEIFDHSTLSCIVMFLFCPSRF